jgi:RimK family alpha-L-glutamate ligase
MSKKGILVENGNWQSSKVDELMEWVVNAARTEGISLTRVRNDDLLVEIKRGQSRVDHPALEEADFVLFWDKDIVLARQMERLGHRLYNRAEAIEVCDNKCLTHQVLSDQGIAMPTTIVAPFIYANMDRKNLDYLDRVVGKLGFPMVVKEAYGSFGHQVSLVEDRDALEAWVRKAGGRPHLYQEYIGECHGEDLRLNVVGGRVVAAMKRKSRDDFRANVTLGGTMEPYQPSQTEEALAIKAARILGLDFAGVDLLQTKDGPLVCEINANVHFKTLYDCTGVDTAAHLMGWIKSGESVE